MIYYCPLDKPDKALELARDKTYEFLDGIVDEGYEPDGLTVTVSITAVGNRYIINIR